MSLPILNGSENYKNVFFFPAYKEAKWFVAAFNNGWITNTPAVIAGKTIINARKDFIVPSSIISEFSTLKGGTSVYPINILNTSNDLTLNLKYNKEHSIKLNVVNDAPYPSLLFSATLSNKASDYENLFEEVKEKLADNTLLSGNLKLSFKGVNIQNRTLIKLKFREILSTILKVNGATNILQSQLSNILSEHVDSNLDNFIETSYSTLNDKEVYLIKEFIINKIQTIVVSNKTEQYYFDNALSYSLLVLRDPLELTDAATNFDFYNSSLTNTTLEY